MSHDVPETHVNDTQKKHHLLMVSKKILEGLNMFTVPNLTLFSDVDQDILTNRINRCLVPMRDT